MRYVATLLVFSLGTGIVCYAADTPSLAGYDSPQAAIDANPGKMVYVPDGDHVIDRKIHVTKDGSGLYGHGRIVQKNSAEPVIEIEHAGNVRIEDITVTRAESAQDATANGILVNESHDVVIDGVRIVDCRARDAAVGVRQSANVTVRDCEIVNYKRIAIDDRTGPNEIHYGYAFWAIDGTGILINQSTGSSITGNRIIERNLLPAQQVKEQYKLGTLTEGKFPSKQGDLAAGAFKDKYVNNWHQGSAIVVTGPEDTHHTIVRGNQIENAAQGIDLHCDDGIVSENVINHAMIGIKGTHGCRNLVISNNIITHVDLWGVLLNPGAASHAAESAEGDKPARSANVDAGIIVSNNIITDYGYGSEYWNWGGKSDKQSGSFAMAFIEGQLPTNPPLMDVLIEGNMVYDTGRDGMIQDGKVAVAPPRYRYAVYVGPWGEGNKLGPAFPQKLHFVNNIFHAGSAGVSNVELTP